MEREILKKIEILEKNARLKLNKKEKEIFLIDYKSFLNSLNEFEKIKLDNIEEIDFPFKITSSYLREDKIYKNEDTSSLLNNSKNIKNNYFILKRKKDEK
ncbi:MAG: hypothetical protein HPAVJP_3290 [Candidatus Hepatoplasma vulgare]|nr:MAG: hypothetical protein HPAVJP_3290 [Candidatus Hepatoplasma sp.]